VTSASYRVPSKPISFTFGGLQTLEKDLRGEYTKLNTALDKLDVDLHALLKEWSGEAQQAYTASHKQWTDAAANMAKLLDTIATTVVTAYNAYVAAESDCQKVWTSVNGTDSGV